MRASRFIVLVVLALGWHVGPAGAVIVAGTWAGVTLTSDSGLASIDLIDTAVGQSADDRACVYLSHRVGDTATTGRTCGPAHVMVDAVAGRAEASGIVDVITRVCAGATCVDRVERVTFELTATASLAKPCGHSSTMFDPQVAFGSQGNAEGMAAGDSLGDLGRPEYSCIGAYVGAG